MHKESLLLAFSMVMLFSLNAQTVKITILDSGRKTSLRGLCVVNDNIIWASGSNGTIVRSTDGGQSFDWLTPMGYEKRDFRDIEAFDANTAIIIAIAEPAIILKTKDAGKNWYKVFEDTTKGMFLDALYFDGERYGTVVGDPVRGHMFVAGTTDSGETWKSSITQPSLQEGEAMFASSGTNIKAFHSTAYACAVVTGGTKSSIILIPANAKIASITVPLQIVQGQESTGANSLAVYRKQLVVVGGDFTRDKDTTKNSLLSYDNGKNWHQPQTPPHGYRSCVEFINRKKLITCGTSGVDISNDGGENWELVTNQGFHVCQKAKKGNKVFLAGGNGKIAVLETP